MYASESKSSIQVPQSTGFSGLYWRAALSFTWRSYDADYQADKQTVVHSKHVVSGFELEIFNWLYEVQQGFVDKPGQDCLSGDRSRHLNGPATPKTTLTLGGLSDGQSATCRRRISICY